MDIYTLGTGAPLHYTRASTGILIEDKDNPNCEPLLIDACSGFEIIRRLVALGRTAEDHHHVLITHKHGDHIGGVMALAIVASPLHVYGSADVLEAAEALLKITYGDSAFNVLSNVQFHEIKAGEQINIAGYNLECFDVQHRVPTHAVKISHNNKVLAISSDSIPCDNVIACAQDADLFLCDAICATTDGEKYVTEARELQHPNSKEAAEMAVQANVKELALVHSARYGTPEKMLAEASNIFPGKVTMPDDNHHFTL